MRPLRIAVQLHPQHGAYDALRRAVTRVEDVGADLLYTWDHFFPLYGDRDGAHFECWSMLAAWAEQTSRVELARSSAALYRNPQLLADMARLHRPHLRWPPRPRHRVRLVPARYDDYGYEFGTHGTLGVHWPRRCRSSSGSSCSSGAAAPGADPHRRHGRADHATARRAARRLLARLS